MVVTRAKGHNNTISKQFKDLYGCEAQLRPRIVSRSIRGANNECSVCYLAADEPRSVDSAVSMMCRDSLITNATTRQSTVRWRRSMTRGARSVSVRSQELSQAGCCVRAVVVFVMVDVSSVFVLCFFFGCRGRGRESRGKGETLELAAIDEKDA
eukprot:scaffold86121_cov36-Cyclotella_meneghiniana.AAC.1